MTLQVVAGEEELGPQKRCTKCGEFWPLLADFYPRTAAQKSGYHSWCKACWADQSKARYAQRKASA